jgi:hypothetical protein
MYGVLIGVEVNGDASVGVVYLPTTDEMIAAADGLGCTWNGRRPRVSNVSRPCGTDGPSSPLRRFECGMASGGRGILACRQASAANPAACVTSSPAPSSATATTLRNRSGRTR